MQWAFLYTPSLARTSALIITTFPKNIPRMRERRGAAPVHVHRYANRYAARRGAGRGEASNTGTCIVAAGVRVKCDSQSRDRSLITDFWLSSFGQWPRCDII